MKKNALAGSIGDAIRSLRESRGISQEAFAEEISMHRTYYSALERGEINLTLKTLKRVSTGLGVKMWEVLKEANS
jgi:transcriptional regulator with XRE-family HTH domain